MNKINALDFGTTLAKILDSLSENMPEEGIL
jgi:hypothetical protein